MQENLPHQLTTNESTIAMLKWIRKRGEPLPTWNLVLQIGKNRRTVATVWHNGPGVATWHTWDHDGTGGENSVEHDPNHVAERAKIESSASAIFQGFI